MVYDEGKKSYTKLRSSHVDDYPHTIYNVVSRYAGSTNILVDEV